MFPDTSAFHVKYFQGVHGVQEQPEQPEQYRVEVKDCDGDSVYNIGGTDFRDETFRTVSGAMMALDLAVQKHKGGFSWSPLTVTVVKVEQTGVIQETESVLLWN
jgi:hypothetical protein